MGLPTMDGNMWAGKFEPAYPHFTNCNTISEYSAGSYGLDLVHSEFKGLFGCVGTSAAVLTPVPLSHTITFRPALSIFEKSDADLTNDKYYSILKFNKYLKLINNAAGGLKKCFFLNRLSSGIFDDKTKFRIRGFYFHSSLLLIKLPENERSTFKVADFLINNFPKICFFGERWEGWLKTEDL